MRDIRNSDDAVVGIFVAILLIGLVITVFSMVQTQYVPQWLEQREYDHMHEVSYQFSQFKYSMDILTLTQQGNAISTYMTLGISDLPFFDKGRTYDSLEILPDSCIVNVSGQTDSLSFSLGTVKYSSGNSYFLDQSYIYEGGVMILSQSGESLLHGKQFLTVNDNTNISFNIINITSFDGKSTAFGFGTYSLYSEFVSSNTYTVYNVTNINITTDYSNAWRLFINSTNLIYSLLNYDIIDTDFGIRVEFSAPLGNMNLNVIEISTQIAPGWIE